MPDIGTTLYIIFAVALSTLVLFFIVQDIRHRMHPPPPRYEPSNSTRTGSIHFYHEGDNEIQFGMDSLILDEISIPDLGLEGARDTGHRSHDASDQIPEPSHASLDVYPATLPVLTPPEPSAGHMFRERSMSVGSSMCTTQIQEGNPPIRSVSWPRAAHA